MNEEFGEANLTHKYKKDEGKTSRFEVWFNDVQIWSKAETGKFPPHEEADFLSKVKEAMK